jgi:predicted Zn-dependent peptidase
VSGSGDLPALRNGVPVAVRPRPGADVTTVSVWVLLGSRHETTPGVTHLLEHVLMQAQPPGRNLRVIDELEGMGADANAVTARDHLALYATIPSPDALDALRVLAAGLTNTDFDPEVVAAEQRVVDEELRLAAADPDDIVHDVFFGAAFAGQPMGRPVGGTPAEVARLTTADLAAWSAANLHTGTVGVVATGDLDQDTVVAALDDGPLAALPVGHGPALDPVLPTTGTAHLWLNSDTTAVLLGGHGVALDDPLLPAVEVLMELLAGANTSVLQEELRSRRGLSYDVWGTATGYRDVGVWRIGIATAPEHAGPVVELAGNLLADAAATGFPADRVAAARRRMAALVRLDAESSLAEVLRMGQHRLVGHDSIWTPRRHADALGDVTAAEVADCAATVLDRFVVATAGSRTPGPGRDVDHVGREEVEWNATSSVAAGPR